MKQSAEPLAVVYFATGRRSKARRLIRFYGWLIRCLTRSELAHCCIGIDGRVIDKTPDGINFIPMVNMVNYPSLVAIILVPLKQNPDTSRFISRANEKVSPWPTLLRFFTMGLLPRRQLTDCLTTTSTLLLEGDVPVSGLRGCWTIRQLYHKLRRAGYATYTATYPGRFVRAVYDAGLSAMED